ncbi:putative ABC transport system ATP-binding protein [Bacillus thermophilus]|uniref:ABC transport system ATP-binding protein n=1 Tax=Siminovitchia thermophila TaxID=1245522 RepID=A0ABS2RAC1_9BACI|nr:ABC transporter ATP-binding protein [Siminovitchia thermophila]MBM7716601.1 putative ABC transport system ATP-binding protein [Siminovitchia thermophila]
MSDCLIEANQLSKTYQMGKVGVSALKKASFTIQKGSFTAIIGTSGSGKSTLLNLLGLIDHPTDGSLTFKGLNVNQLSNYEQTKIRAENIGFIFQSFHLVPVMNILDNVMLQLSFSKKDKKQRKKTAIQALNSVGLGTYLQHYPADLSGGQRQRVSIARALSKDPDLILADEPTGSLDSKSGAGVLDIFKALHKRGKTIIIVTHDLEIASIANQQLVLKDGELLETNTNDVEQLKKYYYR